MIEVVPARASHVRAVAAVLRQADLQEIAATTGGRSALAALAASWRRSRMCWTVLIDGRPECMFGIGDVNILGGVAAPWLVRSDRMVAHRAVFLRRSVEIVAAWSRQYSCLRNVIDCRNTAAIRWLRWLGFSFSAPFSMRGHDFMIFEKGVSDVR